jgi:hypothetical protein
LQQIQIQAQTGQITPEEARQRQQELIGQAVNTLVDRIQNDTSVTVVEEFPNVGAVQVRGTAGQLVDLVELSEAQGLISVSDLEDAAAAQPPDDGGSDGNESGSNESAP